MILQKLKRQKIMSFSQIQHQCVTLLNKTKKPFEVFFGHRRVFVVSFVFETETDF